MNETSIQIESADGVVDGYIITAHASTAVPGVILLTDIFGIREANRMVARRLAELGYAVLMPNVFFRSGGLPVFDFDFHAGGERVMKRIDEVKASLTPEAMERDGSVYVDYLASQPGAASGPMAVAGYCFTGAMALRVAAARPDRIAAAASFHGGRLATDDPSSPHLLLPHIKARLYFGHAVEDRGMPQEAIEKLEAALAAWGGDYESEVYAGARHGWTVPDSAAYNAPQAERAFAKLSELLQQSLKPARRERR